MPPSVSVLSSSGMTSFDVRRLIEREGGVIQTWDDAGGLQHMFNDELSIWYVARILSMAFLDVIAYWAYHSHQTSTEPL